jgi:teichuronic acid biosynthesis glycosyltransferase TuaG
MIKVSIITAAFNAENFLKDTYESLKAQSFVDWEWIVTNDCSTDLTQKILEDLATRDGRVKVLRNLTNQGAGFSRNRSIAVSRGRFLAFIDSDDLWDKDKLTLQIKFMETQSALISFTPYRVISESGVFLGKVVDQRSPKQISYQDLLAKKCTVGCSTVIIDQSKIKVSMSLLRTGQDYATWLSILKVGNIALKYDDPLTSYRIVAGSISRNKFKKALRQWQIYRSVEKLNIYKSIYYFINYAFNAFFRK